MIFSRKFQDLYINIYYKGGGITLVCLVGGGMDFSNKAEGHFAQFSQSVWKNTPTPLEVMNDCSLKLLFYSIIYYVDCGRVGCKFVQNYTKQA